MIVKLVLFLALIKLYYAICILHRLAVSHLPVNDYLKKITTLVGVNIIVMYLDYEWGEDRIEALQAFRFRFFVLIAFVMILIFIMRMVIVDQVEGAQGAPLFDVQVFTSSILL